MTWIHLHQSQEQAINWYGSIFIFAWFHHSSRSPSAQDDLAHLSITIAPSEKVSPQRTTSAPSEQVAPQRTTSAPSELVSPERTTRASSSTAHQFRSIRAGCSKAHHFRSIRTSRPRAHNVRSQSATVQLKKLPSESTVTTPRYHQHPQRSFDSHDGTTLSGLKGWTTTWCTS